MVCTTAVHLAILHVHARNLTYVELSKALVLVPFHPTQIPTFAFSVKVPLDRSHIHFGLLNTDFLTQTQ